MAKTIKEYVNEAQGFFYTAERVIARERTDFQTAELVETKAFGRTLLLDGVTQVSERWEERYHETLVHPAMLTSPAARRVLVIGGGDGGTLREVLKHTSVSHIDFAELDAKVIAFSKRHLPHMHGGAFDDSRVHTHIVDGRAFVEAAAETYDVIIMDMTDPEGPARFLYTLEFFSAVKKILQPDGVFAMHGESPFARPLAFACIQKTLAAVFTHVTTACTFVPMYGTLWSFQYAADRVSAASLSAGGMDARIAARMHTPPRFINGAVWQAVSAAEPAALQAANDERARIIRDAAPDFPPDM